MIDRRLLASRHVVRSMKMLSLDRYTFKKNREANLQLSLPRVASAKHRLSDGFKVDWEQRQGRFYLG